MIKEKQCNRCGKIKPISKFHRGSYKKDMVSSFHSQCKECRHKSYLKNRDKILKKKKEKYWKNPDKIRKQKREWRRKNQIRIRENENFYSIKIRLTVLLYYSGYPPKCACCGETTLKFLGIDHINKNGKKHRREANIHGGRGLYVWLRKNHFPEGFQVLCHNCNFAKGHYGRCPHKPAISSTGCMTAPPDKLDDAINSWLKSEDRKEEKYRLDEAILEKMVSEAKVRWYFRIRQKEIDKERFVKELNKIFHLQNRKSIEDSCRKL